MVKVKNNKKSNIQNQIVKVILGGELSKLKKKDKKDKKGKKTKGKGLDNLVKPPFNRPQSNFLPPPQVLPGPPSVPGRFNTFPAPPSVNVRSDAPLSSVGSSARSAVSSAVPMDIATVLSSLVGSSNRSAVSSATPMELQTVVESAVSRALSRSKNSKPPEADTETGSFYDYSNDFSGLPSGMQAPSDVYPDDSASQVFGASPPRKRRGRPPKQKVIKEEEPEDVELEQRPPSAPPKPELSQADGQLSRAPLTNGGEHENGGGHTAEARVGSLYQAEDQFESGIKRPAPSTVSTAIVQDEKRQAQVVLPVVSRSQLNEENQQYFDDISSTYSGTALSRLIQQAIPGVQFEGGAPSWQRQLASVIASPYMEEFDAMLERNTQVSGVFTV
jgi:hypothetical protein